MRSERHLAPASAELLKHMMRFASLSEPECMFLRNLPVLATYRAGADISSSDGAAAPQFLVSGWACHYSSLADGRRQILNFLLPGDAIGLSRDACLGARRVRALTVAQAADAKPVLELRHDGIAAALAAAECDVQARLVAHIVRLGRQTAYERTAHLLLELYYRLAAVDLASFGSMPMPLTQEVFADALGLSTVHVNRTLQQLRRDRLLEMQHGRATLHDLPRLHALCDFA